MLYLVRLEVAGQTCFPSYSVSKPYNFDQWLKSATSKPARQREMICAKRV
jgi:hypothetical protein